MKWIWLASFAVAQAQPLLIQQRFDYAPAPTTHAGLLAQPVPVTAADITDRPYRVLGEIHAEVGSLTILSRRPTQADVYRELWQRAQRLGADAVIRAEYGQVRLTLFRPRARRATGVAIKFLAEGETPQRH